MNNNDNKKIDVDPSSSRVPSALCLGLVPGIILGIVLDNIGLWMTAGAVIGLCAGVILDHNAGNTDDSDQH